MDTYYKASGKFAPSSIIYLLLISITALPILGLIYAYAAWYIPLPYINFLITAGFGFLIGLLVNFIIKKGKVRNSMIALIFGLLAGIIGLYFHWAVWVDLVINAGESYGNSRIGVTVSNIKILDVFILAANPVQLFELIGEINQYGTWGIKGMVPTGTLLYVLWAVELLIVVVISSMLPFIRAKQPFCEKSVAWFEEKELTPLSFIAEPNTMKTSLENKETNIFDTITLAENVEGDHSIFTLYSSKHNENYISIENKKAKLDDKGKLDFDNNLFVEYISIDATLKEALISKSKI